MSMMSPRVRELVDSRTSTAFSRTVRICEMDKRKTFFITYAIFQVETMRFDLLLDLPETLDGSTQRHLQSSPRLYPPSRQSRYRHGATQGPAAITHIVTPL